MHHIPAASWRWLRTAANLIAAVASCTVAFADRPTDAITIGYNEYRPLVYSVPGQRPAGFVVQVLEEAARREGVRLEWAAVKDSPPQALRDGKVQIWPVYPAKAPDAAGLHFTRPWWRTEFSLFMHSETAVPNALQWTGSVALQDFPTTNEAAQALPHAIPRRFPDTTKAIAAFCRGETSGLLIGYFRAQSLLAQRPAVCRDTQFEMAVVPEAGTDLSMFSAPGPASVVADGLRRRIDEMAVDGTLLRVALHYPGILPGMAVYLQRLAENDTAMKRRSQQLLALAGVVLIVAALAARLLIDRKKRRSAEVALQASEDRLRLALVAASMRPWDWNEERGSISDPDELRRLDARVKAALETGAAVELEYQIGERWMLAKAHAVPLRDRLTGIAIDITDRKRAELARAEVEERFRRAVLESPMPMMIYAADGEVLNLSRSWSERSGYSIEDIPTLRRWHTLAIQNDEPDAQVGEMRIVTRTGQIRTWLLTRASLGRLSDGRALALLAGVDLTDHNRTEEQLRRANVELEQYAYAAAHDLQEPMRIIGLYSQLLLRRHGEELSPQAEPYLSTIEKEARRMTGIVSGLVSYSRLVSETDPISMSPVPLSGIVTQVVEEMRSVVAARSAQIHVDPLPMVLGEPGALRSVIRHLLSNAIQYVPAEVRPEVRVLAARLGDSWVVSVVDNGSGIAPEYHDRIWGVFKRLHGHENPGTGIGLAVVRKVIQQHGGRVWVESVGNGTGSTFRFTLRAPEGEKSIPSYIHDGSAILKLGRGTDRQMKQFPPESC